MTKSEMLEFIKNEGAEVFNEVTAELGLKQINKETVENYFKTDEGKSILFSKYDLEHSRRFKKYKEDGGFAKDFDTEYQKRNPQMTEEAKKLMELETKVKDYERKEVVSNNFKELSSMNENYKLPKNVFKMLVGEDLELSRKQIEEVGSEFLSHTNSLIETRVTEKLGSSQKPIPTGAPIKAISMEQYTAMSKHERMNIPLEEVEKIFGGN
ncbi:MAG: hypothetical protein ACRC6A_09215 [Fusobacteriaceae bacterium]